MRRLVIDQSSPVQPVSKSRGGTLSVTSDRRRRTEILVFNIGFSILNISLPDIEGCRLHCQIDTTETNHSGATSLNMKVFVMNTSSSVQSSGLKKCIMMTLNPLLHELECMARYVWLFCYLSQKKNFKSKFFFLINFCFQK